MNSILPGLTHRDDIEPSSAAAMVERTYDYSNRPSRRLRREGAPVDDPLADDPGSAPRATADELMADAPGLPVEDYEGMQSRRTGERRRSAIKVSARKIPAKEAPAKKTSRKVRKASKKGKASKKKARARPAARRRRK